jgi:hypothetical protein
MPFSSDGVKLRMGRLERPGKLLTEEEIGHISLSF